MSVSFFAPFEIKIKEFNKALEKYLQIPGLFKDSWTAGSPVYIDDLFIKIQLTNFTPISAVGECLPPVQ